jgi:hypothetical protein
MGSDTGVFIVVQIPRPTRSTVGVRGRDSIVGVFGSGFSLNVESLLALFLCARLGGFSLEMRKAAENLYGVTMIG